MPTLAVDAATQYQTIDGFGASLCWEDAMSDADADFWFGSSGLGCSLARISVMFDGDFENPTNMAASWMPYAAPYASGIANALKAQARGAKVWGTTSQPPTEWMAYNPPAYKMGLSPARYSDWANRLATFCGTTAPASGVTMHAMSLQNEPTESSDGGGTCYYSPAEIAAFLGVMGPAMRSAAPATAIMAPEATAWSALDDWIGPALAAYPQYLDIIATHDYGGTPHAPTGSGSRKIWQTEASDWSSPWDPSWSNAITRWAPVWHAAMAAGVSAYHMWWFYAPAWGDPGSPNDAGLATARSSGMALAKRAWAFGNYSRFIRPGAVRVSCTGASGGMLATAYVNPSGSPVVVITNPGAAQFVTLSGSAFDGRNVTPWLTNASTNLLAQSVIPYSAPASYTVPASSVVTLVGSAFSVSVGTPSGGSVVLSGARASGSTVTVTRG